MFSVEENILIWLSLLSDIPVLLCSPQGLLEVCSKGHLTGSIDSHTLLGLEIGVFNQEVN